MQHEIYRPITGYRNYEVSNLGNVRNTDTDRILKNCKNKLGYYYVGLYSDGKAITKAVHQLVAKEFLRNPKGYVIVDHIDNDKSNNTKNNLRYCTQRQNCQNQRLACNNTTGCKGVYLIKKTGRYQASITINGKLHHIGIYPTIQEAKRNRSKMARKHYGKFRNACD